MSKLIRWFRPVSRYMLALWGIFIIIFSTIPPSFFPEIKIISNEFRIDHLAHFIEYTGLTILALLAIVQLDYSIKAGKLRLALLFLIAFALLDEGHQSFIPWRSFELSDLFFDLLGITSGLIITLGILKNARRKAAS